MQNIPTPIPTSSKKMIPKNISDRVLHFEKVVKNDFMVIFLFFFDEDEENGPSGSWSVTPPNRDACVSETLSSLPVSTSAAASETINSSSSPRFRRLPLPPPLRFFPPPLLFLM